MDGTENNSNVKEDQTTNIPLKHESPLTRLKTYLEFGYSIQEPRRIVNKELECEDCTDNKTFVTIRPMYQDMKMENCYPDNVKQINETKVTEDKRPKPMTDTRKEDDKVTKKEPPPEAAVIPTKGKETDNNKKKKNVTCSDQR